MGGKKRFIHILSHSCSYYLFSLMKQAAILCHVGKQIPQSSLEKTAALSKLSLFSKGMAIAAERLLPGEPCVMLGFVSPEERMLIPGQRQA